MCNTLFKEIIGTLQDSDYEYGRDETRTKWKLLRLATRILADSPLALKQAHSAEIRDLVQGLSNDATSSSEQQTAKRILSLCTDCELKDFSLSMKIQELSFLSEIEGCIRVLKGHTSRVTCVAFSPVDDKRIVSGSWDNTLRIWDCETGNPVGKPFEGHTDNVRSVAFSPDGTRVASGSYDKTIRLWDLSTGKQSGKPIQGHTDYVNSVAIFLGDQGKHVLASGSSDKTIRILDAKTGTWDKAPKPFHGDTEPICSVAFSPDGKQIVSGSQDKTVRIWDFETGAQAGEALGRDFHSDVFSVAFSPDVQRVVSGSQDGEVRIWELTGKQVGKPFRIKGHTGPVHLVAFSNDGEYIVSGSGDKTVCIWDSKTGKQVGKPLQGHMDAVQSVAFSSDGKRIVSGSRDNTIQIWDAGLLYLNPSLDDADEDTNHIFTATSTDIQVPQRIVDARYSPTFAELTKITIALLLSCILCSHVLDYLSPPSIVYYCLM